MKYITLLLSLLSLSAGAQSYPRIGYAGIIISNVVGAAHMTGSTPVAPIITSGPTVNETNTVSATIAWITDINTTNDFVLYSTDTSYSLSQSSPEGGAIHSITISGLSANTVYNYKVGSAADGLATYSSSFAFRTAAVSGGGVLTVDIWQDFEFSTIDAASLTAHDHTTNGSWTVTDVSASMSTTTGAERAISSGIIGTTDTGTLGLHWVVAGTSPSYVKYLFGSNPNANPISFGFWLKSPTVTGTTKRIATVGNIGGSPVAIVSWEYNRHIQLSGTTTVNGSVALVADTWYWITGKVQQSGACSLSAYSTSGVLTDQISVTGNNNATQVFIIGNSAGFGTADTGMTFSIDDVVIDRTTATYPIGP